MEDLLVVFGENIKRFRSVKNISQAELSDSMGIGQARLSRIENGKVDVGLSTVGKIADRLGVTIAELLVGASGSTGKIEEKILQLEMLSEYDQKLVDALLESLLEKSRLIDARDMKMRYRLEELNNIRKRK